MLEKQYEKALAIYVEVHIMISLYVELHNEEVLYSVMFG